MTTEQYTQFWERIYNSPAVIEAQRQNEYLRNLVPPSELQVMLASIARQAIRPFESLMYLSEIGRPAYLDTISNLCDVALSCRGKTLSICNNIINIIQNPLWNDVRPRTQSIFPISKLIQTLAQITTYIPEEDTETLEENVEDPEEDSETFEQIVSTQLEQYKQTPTSEKLRNLISTLFNALIAPIVLLLLSPYLPNPAQDKMLENQETIIEQQFQNLAVQQERLDLEKEKLALQQHIADTLDELCDSLDAFDELAQDSPAAIQDPDGLSQQINRLVQTLSQFVDILAELEVPPAENEQDDYQNQDDNFQH